MKQIILLFSLLLILLVFCTHFGYSQEKKGNLWVNLSLSHYQEVNENELNLGGVPYNVSPGFELLYQRKIASQFYIKTGLFYQYFDIQSHIYGAYRFQFGEISVPFLFQYDLAETGKNHLSISSGIYAGKFLHFKWLNKTKLDWEPLDPYMYENYSDKNFFMDFILDVKYQFISKGKKGVNIGPFFHFRFYENWMEHYRKSLYYGIQ